jgi:hypothetical protein
MWGFTMTVDYSRRMFAAAATDQKLGTLLRMHEAAFYEWGAAPDETLYDRMKTVWSGVDERGEIVWIVIFLDFTRYWGFTPRLCRPCRAFPGFKLYFPAEPGLAPRSARAPLSWRHWPADEPGACIDFIHDSNIGEGAVAKFTFG